LIDYHQFRLLLCTYENHSQFLNMTKLTLVAAGLATVAVAQQCQNLTVPIEITALKSTFDLNATKTNIDVANFILELTRPAANYTKEVLQEEKVSA